MRVIRAIPDQILTAEELVEPTHRDGFVVADPNRDLAKLVCLERHGHNQNIAVALATGFGIQRGAIAGTVAHDHHNCMAMGVSDEDILLASKTLGEIGGGLVAVSDGKVIACLPLPIAGLLTDRPLHEVRDAMLQLDRAASELVVLFLLPLWLFFPGPRRHSNPPINRPRTSRCPKRNLRSTGKLKRGKISLLHPISINSSPYYLLLSLVIVINEKVHVVD